MHRRESLLGMALLMLLATSMLVPFASANPQSTAIYSQDRMVAIQANPDAPFSKTYSVQEGDWFSISAECDACEITVASGGETLSSPTGITTDFSDEGTMTLTISSSIEEMIYVSTTGVTRTNHITTRPSPSEDITLDSKGLCTDVDSCLDADTGHLSSIVDNYSEFYINGIVEDASEYYPINVSKGDTLELSLFHATADFHVQAYFQDSSSESLFEQEISSEVGLVPGQGELSAYWLAPEDGRILLKISSDSPNLAWAAKRVIHAATGTLTLDEFDLTYSGRMVGHDSATALISWEENSELVLLPQVMDVDVRISQISDGNLILGEWQTASAESSLSLFAYPDVSALKIEFYAPVFWVDIIKLDYSDFSTSLEAPSNLPMSNSSDNSSWPLLPIDDEIRSGELTLSIHDMSDVYRIELEGWEDSIHFVKITAMGDIEHLKLEMWNMDQETWVAKDAALTTYQDGKLEISMMLDRGTHFFRIGVIEDNPQHEWGEKIDSAEYQISTYYNLEEEGEEPWFPPDKNAKKWGGVARWFLGSLFLLPVFYLVFTQVRANKLAKELASNKARLAWFKQRLDSGEATVQTSRKEITRALSAISQLDWKDACETWGDSELSHRTDNLDISVWRLDQRLAKKEGAWPILIGIHVLEGKWEICALRLDSPQDSAWKVVNVSPRFLFNGEEVFLDTLGEKSKTFLTVELEGDSQSVDIEINGRMNDVAMAARIPATLYRTEESSE